MDVFIRVDGKGARLLGDDGGRQREAARAWPRGPPGPPCRDVRGDDQVSATGSRQRGVSKARYSLRGGPLSFFILYPVGLFSVFFVLGVRVGVRVTGPPTLFPM